MKRAAIVLPIAVDVAAIASVKLAKPVRIVRRIAGSVSFVEMAFAKRENRAVVARAIVHARVATKLVRPMKTATIVQPIAARVAETALAKPGKIATLARAIADRVVEMARVMRVKHAGIAPTIARVVAMAYARAEKIATIALLIASPRVVMACVNAAKRVEVARVIAVEAAAIPRAVMDNAARIAAKIHAPARAIAA